MRDKYNILYKVNIKTYTTYVLFCYYSILEPILYSGVLSLSMNRAPL